MSELPEAGDQDLFGRLFARHHRPLVRFLTRMTRCPQQAEDLAQDAWLRVLGVWSRGACPAQAEDEIRAYLYTVARNAFLDKCTRKHEAVRTRAVDPAELDGLVAGGASAPGPDDDLQRLQTHRLLGWAVAALPAEQRAVIVMWSRGTSIKDMAATAAAPVDTVLSRKKYAVAHMRTALAGMAHAMG